MKNEIRQIKTQPYLQAHCQSPTSQRNSQSFVKELANPTLDKIVFKKFPSPSEKIKNATHNPTKNSWTKTAKTHITNNLTRTKDRRPACNTGLAKVAVKCFYDSLVGSQTVVHLINFCGENRHLRQARNR
jgi:hypothetical protein